MTKFDRALVRMLPLLPRQIVRAAAAPYLAGESMQSALRTAEKLQVRGRLSTIDVLGEEVKGHEETRQVVVEYRNLVTALRSASVDVNISVKPTGLGLRLDSEFCRENLESVVSSAGQGAFVRIDMEDASTTDATLNLYRRLRSDGYDQVGVVLQARLHRTLDDVAALAPLRPNVRICKGIYPESPNIAHSDSGQIRESYLSAMEALFDAHAYVAIATHDAYLIAEAKRMIERRGLSPDDYEFQMLLGVREDLGDALIREGRHLRIYVPYGRRWYEYSLRRLQENPQIAHYVAADTFRRIRTVRPSAKASQTNSARRPVS